MECGMDLMVFPLLLQHVNQKLWIAFVLRRDIANCGFLGSSEVQIHVLAHDRQGTLVLSYNTNSS